MNFGIVYGLSAFGLSRRLGIDQREAKKFIDAYFEKYAGVRRYIDRILEETRKERRENAFRACAPHPGHQQQERKHTRLC